MMIIYNDFNEFRGDDFMSTECPAEMYTLA